MNHIDKALKNAIDEEATLKPLNEGKFLDVCTLELEEEIINYNKKLHNIIKNNKIYFNNEVSFMLQIKDQSSNKELLPLVICFLCDKKYIDKFKDEKLNSLVKGDIATYVLLKVNIEKFFDKLRYIESKRKKEMDKEYGEVDPISYPKDLKELINETYEKCNCININRIYDDFKNFCGDNEKYIRRFIKNNLKIKTIDYKIYMKRLAEKKEEGTAYLIEVVKKLLKFNEDDFIKEVEHVNEFYSCLEEIMEEEIEKEFETIMSCFLQNAILKD